MKKDIVIKIIVGIVVCISIILGLAKAFHADTLIENNKVIRESWEYIYKEDYDKAVAVLKNIDTAHHSSIQYRQKSFIQDFCHICITNEEGNYNAAHLTMENIERYESAQNILSERQLEYVNKKYIEVSENYDAHKAEYEAELQRKKEELEAEKEKSREEAARKRQEAPYVGMFESQINSTDLGPCSKYIEHFNTEMVNGKVMHCSMYYWKTSEGYIYSARCGNGKVLNVSDYRDAPREKTVDEQAAEALAKYYEENPDEFDPDDHDIEQYYLDFKDSEGFESIDDAWDDFEDNPEYWDEY